MKKDLLIQRDDMEYIRFLLTAGIILTKYKDYFERMAEKSIYKLLPDIEKSIYY